jgi:peroxiredoxin
MQETYGGEDFSVIGLMEGSSDSAAAFARAQKVNYPILSESPDFDTYDIFFVPVTYLVDPSGQIVADDMDDAEAILAQQVSR